MQDSTHTERISRQGPICHVSLAPQSCIIFVRDQPWYPLLTVALLLLQSPQGPPDPLVKARNVLPAKYTWGFRGLRAGTGFCCVFRLLECKVPSSVAKAGAILKDYSSVEVGIPHKQAPCPEIARPDACDINVPHGGSSGGMSSTPPSGSQTLLLAVTTYVPVYINVPK